MSFKGMILNLAKVGIVLCNLVIKFSITCPLKSLSRMKLIFLLAICTLTIYFEKAILAAADDEDFINYPLSSSSDSGDDVEYFDDISFKTTTTPPPITRRTQNQQGNQSPKHHPRIPLGSPQFFPNDDDGGRAFDLGGFGGSPFPGTREVQFVEVRIGEFSVSDEFARVYGKQVNYSSSLGKSFEVSEFLGVPFAEAPVKNLRFQRPIMRHPFDELLALRQGEPCPQISIKSGKAIGVEDCLHLNIYVPSEIVVDPIDFNRQPKKLPVLVWFHGEIIESFEYRKLSMLSSGSAKDLDPFIFLQKKLIVVTPQYRLGSLGFLSAKNEVLNGNMGLLDQVTALEWVQRYISYFGGDPTQITVMGQGSSATTLGLLSTSTSSRSLFHRMILMSGSPSSPLAFDTNEKLTLAEISKENNCPSNPPTQFVRCMQTKRVESIVMADNKLKMGKHLGKLRIPLPVIQKGPDGRYLPPLIHEDPLGKIEKGQFLNVPIIIGVTNSEMSGFLASLSGKQEVEFNSTIFTGSNVLRQFIRQVLARTPFNLDMESVSRLVTFEYFSGLNISERQEQAKDLIEEMLSDYLFYMPALRLANVWSRFAPVYLYVFDYVPFSNEDVNSFGAGSRQVSASLPSPIIQAIHGSDLLFLMKSYKSTANEDKQLASILIDTWANFIKKGLPLQSDSGIPWPEYKEAGSQEYLHVSDEIQIQSRFRARQAQFWMELLKELGRNSKECQKSNSS